jgi:CheY-like chemotaxis protein
MTSPSEQPRGASILVVEDDRDTRDTLRLALEGTGYNVRTASSGKEALELLKAIDPPCLILLDLMMPVMSGSEFLVALRDDQGLESIPVLILSAWRREAARVEGAQGFVVKPIDLDVLMKAVGEQCSSRSGTSG